MHDDVPRCKHLERYCGKIDQSLRVSWFTPDHSAHPTSVGRRLSAIFQQAHTILIIEGELIFPTIEESLQFPQDI